MVIPKTDANDAEHDAPPSCPTSTCLARIASDPDVRILRRVVPRAYAPIEAIDGTRLGLIVDVETTGLHATARFEGDAEPPDEIIELCALPFTYRVEDGALVAVHAPYTGLREPSKAIPEDISRLTGITDAMVRGRTITLEDFDAAVGDLERVAIVLAHNATFDWGFLEAFEPLTAFFRSRPWACTVEDAEWPSEGLGSGKLEFVAAMGFGLLYAAHRAEDDCRVLAEILARPTPATLGTVLAKVLASARRGRHRVTAFAPFACRHALKARGYRWDPGSAERPKGWFKDVADLDAAEVERTFVTRLVADGSARCTVVRIDAFDRHSRREGGRRVSASHDTEIAEVRETATDRLAIKGGI